MHTPDEPAGEEAAEARDRSAAAGAEAEPGEARDAAKAAEPDSSEVIAREATPAPAVAVEESDDEPGGAGQGGSATAEAKVVTGSPLKALGVLALLAGLAGGVGAAVQYAQFVGGEVAQGQVLRVDERQVRKLTVYRYLVRLERDGEAAEGYLDSSDKLATNQRITVTYHPGARRELVLGDGRLQRMTLIAFGAVVLAGVVMLLLARRRRTRKE